MNEITASSVGFSGAQAIHAAIYTPKHVFNYGTSEMHDTLLPELPTGKREPGVVASLNPTQDRTRRQ